MLSAVFVDRPLAVLGTVAIIVVGKAAIAWLIVRAFRLANATALTAAASLAQIGEFSFILIGLALEFGLVPGEARDLVLAGAIVSILINPLVFALLERSPQAQPQAATTLVPSTLSGHDVLIGYGRVGSLIGAALAREGAPMVVIETSDSGLEKARADGAEVFEGNAASGRAAGRGQSCRRAPAVRHRP